jgi:antitoxin MazE
MISSILTISAWGNSHGIRLSRELMQAMQITPDTPLEVQVLAPGRLEVRAASRKLTLAQKLKAFDPAIHGGEVMPDLPRGAEFGARR